MKRYEKYKDSGVEWIGEIPARWEVKRLKFNTYIKARVGWHGLRADEFSLTDGVFCITGTDLQNGKVNWENCYRVSEDRYNEDPYIQVNEKDLLITKDGTIGKVAVVQNLREKATLNSGVFVVRPEREQYSTPYMYWAFQSPVFSEYVYYASKGSTINHLYQETFFNLPFILPQPTEQTAIAAYLDEKTARIDKLIANKQKLIELLREERTAIINHAVTKGINPKAKLKPSGIEWLGDIPEHWKVCKLKHLIKVKDGTHDTPDYIPPSEESYPLITSKDIKSGKIDFSDAKHISKEDYAAINERSDVAFGDVIMPMIGTVGGAALVTTEKKFSIKNVALFKTSISDVNGPYFSYLIDSKFIYSQFDLASRGGVQGFVSLDVLRNLLVFKIEFQEQANIVRHIEFATQKIDATISKIEKEIELMQEYRTALISEVVTGKIKVI